jgi:methyl-accepting chemotaxis protein
MSGMTLKSKLIFGAMAMLVIPMAVSIAVVFVVINQQNRSASHDRLFKSIDIIRDDLSAKLTKLASDTAQLAAGNEMGGRINMLSEYKGDDSMEVLTKNTYMEVTKDVHRAGKTSGLWQTAVYDLQGDLVSFAVEQAEGDVLVGYATAANRTTLNVASLKAGEDWGSGAWQKLENLPDESLALKFGKDLPKEAVALIKPIGKSMCLVSCSPILATAYNKETNTPEKQQRGFALGVLKLNEPFVGKMSSLTGMKVNIFSTEVLSTGSLPEYKKLRADPFKQIAGKWDMAKQEVLLNDVDIQDEAYFQGVLPLHGDAGQIGAIAALYSKEVARANTWQMTRLLTIVYLGCILVIIPLSILFSNSLSKPINAAMQSLTDAAREVSSASAHVSSSSQKLAEAAAEQAASLEETSSSLEEMASMTRQNTLGAAQSDELSKQAASNLTEANESMKALIRSMEDTSTASGDVARIIKSIDEIAFQTNLLALNAAVEAARAGEAGAGFAVVADEVRNLAMRAAEAAGNTQEMVGDIIRRIAEGSNLVKTTDDKYHDVTMRVEKVTGLVSEISAASREQAQGIEQINKAVAEIDRVTQQSATNAEESASASHELSAQSEQMQRIVEQLQSLVGGRKDG